MCDKCGDSLKDILIRSGAYGAVRFIEGMGAIDKLEESVIEGVGLTDETKSKSKENKQLVPKMVVNGAIDYGFNMWLDPLWKKQMPNMYISNPVLGLCPCELMKGFWQLLGQIIYEKLINGKVHGGSVVKDAVAIYAQYPIHKLVSNI